MGNKSISSSTQTRVLENLIWAKSTQGHPDELPRGVKTTGDRLFYFDWERNLVCLSFNDHVTWFMIKDYPGYRQPAWEIVGLNLVIIVKSNDTSCPVYIYSTDGSDNLCGIIGWSYQKLDLPYPSQVTAQDDINWLTINGFNYRLDLDDKKAYRHDDVYDLIIDKTSLTLINKNERVEITKLGQPIGHWKYQAKVISNQTEAYYLAY